jgi:leader peptidase (prepilin peptidase) / N-methyltransferase
VNEPFYRSLFAAFAFVLGAAVGSFLNVCIYRLPRDLSVNRPRRSFCPHCGKEIPWHQNIPLVSWLVLRGRCANCGKRIAFRYFGVELLTALLFLAIWRAFPWPFAIVYAIFVSILIVATFVDFEHYIIPDEVTIGGIIAGVVCSFVLPAMMRSESRWIGLLMSLFSAALGYLLLLFVLEAGKLAFGRKNIRLAGPTAFTWTRQGEDADLLVGEERSTWSEHFAREKDLLILRCEKAEIDGEKFSPAELKFHYDRVRVGDREFVLDQVNEISGVVSAMQIPREAMGRGDLKFLGAIGAFLGWRGVLFSVFAGSLVGSIVGIATLFVARRGWSPKLPFGPYLAFGALSWLFIGERLMNWYLTILNP